MGAVEILLSVVFGAAFATGIALTTSGGSTEVEFFVARVCYVVAALALVSAYVIWLRNDREKPASSTSREIFYGIIVLLLVVVGTPLVLRWVSIRQAAQAIRPAPTQIVEITVGPTLDKYDPVATRFIVANRGEATLYQLHYACTIRVKRNDGQKELIDRGDVISDSYTLKTDEQQSLSCDLAESKIDISKESSLFLVVAVDYKTSFTSPITKFGTIFLMKRDRDGAAQWLPQQSGVPKDLYKLIVDTDPP